MPFLRGILIRFFSTLSQNQSVYFLALAFVFQGCFPGSGSDNETKPELISVKYSPGLDTSLFQSGDALLAFKVPAGKKILAYNILEESFSDKPPVSDSLINFVKANNTNLGLNPVNMQLDSNRYLSILSKDKEVVFAKGDLLVRVSTPQNYLVAGIKVSLRPQNSNPLTDPFEFTQRTDSLGTARFRGLSKGSYTVQGGSTQQGLEFLGRIEEFNADSARLLDFSTQPKMHWFGYISRASGESPAQIEVYVPGTNLKAKTDSSGFYYLGVAPLAGRPKLKFVLPFLSFAAAETYKENLDSGSIVRILRTEDEKPIEVKVYTTSVKLDSLLNDGTQDSTTIQIENSQALLIFSTSYLDSFCTVESVGALEVGGSRVQEKSPGHFILDDRVQGVCP